MEEKEDFKKLRKGKDVWAEDTRKLYMYTALWHHVRQPACSTGPQEAQQQLRGRSAGLLIEAAEWL